MYVTDIFEGLLIKLHRAEHHLKELSDLVEKFIASGPYEIITELNAQGTHRIFSVRLLKDVPLEIPVMIGDVLHNLRSSLDHLACHLVEIGPGPRAKRVYFPIFQSVVDYEAGKISKIGGITRQAMDAVDTVQPYKLGNGWPLWNLQVMNNQDKHRLLIPAWISVIGRSLYRSERATIENALRETFPTGLPKGMLAATPGINFLEDGAVLCSVPITELDEHMDFRLHMAFREPEDVKGKEIISTLGSIRTCVSDTIHSFREKKII